MLPCVHKHWVKGLLHHDPFRRHDGANALKIMELVDAVSTGKKVILTKDTATTDSDGNVIGFERTAYIAVYSVDDVTFSPQDGLKFRLTERLLNLV